VAFDVAGGDQGDEGMSSTSDRLIAYRFTKVNIRLDMIEKQLGIIQKVKEDINVFELIQSLREYASTCVDGTLFEKAARELEYALERIQELNDEKQELRRKLSEARDTGRPTQHLLDENKVLRDTCLELRQKLADANDKLGRIDREMKR